MERQQEYEIRTMVADAIKRDVNNVFEKTYLDLNHNFCNEILIPLTILEMKYKQKSEESIAMGLGISNELLILVNPLREAVYWFIKRILAKEKNIRPVKNAYIPESDSEMAFIEFVLRLHDEYKRGEQIREIRECSTKVALAEESENKYSFHFPVITDTYNKEMLYYYGMDDTLNSEKEREIFIECERYLTDKINVGELITTPTKIHIFYNILNRMAKCIDIGYFELCKKRILSDLNKVSSTDIRSIDDKTGNMIIKSKDEVASFLALLYYLSRICMQRYMLSSSTCIGKEEYICQYSIPQLLALGNQIGLAKECMMRYIEYFSMNAHVEYGNFTEFPLLKFNETIIWIPSSVVLNDFQFSLVNGHYYKNIRFENKDETVSQSIVDYIVDHAKRYNNVIYSTNYCYDVKEEKFRGKPFNSDIDVAIYDQLHKKVLIIECKWKENVYQNYENYVRIEDAFKKIFDNQLEKHQAYLQRDIGNLTQLFGDQVDFSQESDFDILYLFVDKRIQYHDNKANRHAIPIFMLAYLFEKYSPNGVLSLVDVFEEIRDMESKIKYERIPLKEPVCLGEITVC